MRNSIFDAATNRNEHGEGERVHQLTDEILMRQQLHALKAEVMLEFEDQFLRVRTRSAALPAVDEQSMLVQRTGRMLIVGTRRLNDTELNLLRHRCRAFLNRVSSSRIH